MSRQRDWYSMRERWEESNASHREPPWNRLVGLRNPFQSPSHFTALLPRLLSIVQVSTQMKRYTPRLADPISGIASRDVSASFLTER